METKIVRDFEAKSVDMAAEFANRVTTGKYKALAGMMTGNTALVLLGSRRVYRGPKAIIGFWRGMKRKGLAGIRIEVRKKVLMPIDILMSEPDGSRAYLTYDLENYVFGTYEIVYKAKGSVTAAGELLILPLHQNGCPRKLMLIVMSGL